MLATEIGGKEVTLQGEVRFVENPEKKTEYKKASDKVANLIVNLAAIERLTKNCDELEIYTDSSWVVAGWDAGWLDKWRENNWKNSQGEPVAHADLWQQVLRKLEEFGLTPKFHLMEHHPWTNWFEREAERITNG